MEQLFGTDGIRGLAGEFPLDEKTVRIIGASLARQFREKLGRQPRFITGRDTRESGEWIENAFHEGANSENAICESAAVITTPGLAYLTRAFDFDAGIVISASHNPYEDNGIKIFSPTGKKVGEETERQIERDIFLNEAGNSYSKDIAVHASRAGEFRLAYLDHLKTNANGFSASGIKMVVDCANGASFALAPTLFVDLGATTIAINAAPNGKNIKNLTNSPGYDAEATISPDGKKIIFTSERDGDLELYSMDINGKNIKRLTHEPGYDGGAFYSPDNKMIVYRGSHPTDPALTQRDRDFLKQHMIVPIIFEVWTMNADGLNKRQVTKLGAASFAPFFTPDGKRLIFCTNYFATDSRKRNFDLALINIDGTGLERITFNESFDVGGLFELEQIPLLNGFEIAHHPFVAKCAVSTYERRTLPFWEATNELDEAG